jgi:hypothetical protein
MSSYSYDAFEADVECLYNHLQAIKKIEAQDNLVDRFQRLFVEGIGYPQPVIQSAIYRIVESPWAEQQFNLILNRCFYILINYWWRLPSGREATADLVGLFENLPDRTSICLVIQRLRELVQQFTQSKEYAALQRWVWAAKEPANLKQETQTRPIGELIHRYPMLYPHYLLEYNSSEWGGYVIKQRQVEREQQFEDSLLQYARHRMRQSALRRSGDAARSPVLPEIENPTLLSDQALEAAIRQFAGKGIDSRTYRDAARLLMIKTSQAQTYVSFKRQLYTELTAFVREAYCLNHEGKRSNYDYGRHYFNNWLNEQLSHTLPEWDTLKLNASLRVRTCARLLDLLLDVPRDRATHHLIFIDLTTNLGATLTVGLLLKIVLLCYDEKRNLEAIKSHLASRFALLFKHYELSVRDGVNWLIDCLENWMIAVSIQFGKAGDSWWTTLVSKAPNSP